MFVTVWIGIIDLKTGIMKCVNGGHEQPFLRKEQGDSWDDLTFSRKSHRILSTDRIRYKTVFRWEEAPL